MNYDNYYQEKAVTKLLDRTKEILDEKEKSTIILNHPQEAVKYI
ncbi:hypothetical protein MNB_ARC-1_880 [hydrothermal vent metagenome]|uniref:Uncharacterized protein n=1 Tax=hydrothermal vent metagenome TaxID=652676 RepID=A0A3B1E6D9_9ZZZZ